MTYAKKVVLYCPSGYDKCLDALIEDFMRDGVVFVGVAGKDCARIEDIIDELVVGNGDRTYQLLTFSHPGVSVAEVVEFARSMPLESEREVQVVEL